MLVREGFDGIGDILIILSLLETPQLFKKELAKKTILANFYPYRLPCQKLDICCGTGELPTN